MCQWERLGNSKTTVKKRDRMYGKTVGKHKIAPWSI